MELVAGADLVWYDDTSTGDVPLVLLHPGIADSTIWDRLLPLLDDYRVIRFDRRGFGRSAPATEEYTALRDLVAVLDHLGLERAHLVGNSMGGETALALAVTEPDRVASLTLLCPGIGGYPWPEDDYPELVAAWTAAKEAGDVPALAKIQEGMWFAAGTDDYLSEQVLKATELDFSPAGPLEQENPEQWSKVAAITAPTTVVAGALDPADSLQASVDLAARIPGAELVRLDADHVPQYRDPEGVAAALVRTVTRS
ncbi:MAG: alpha/beta hydrolase [Nocardioidaceae bacterium]|nr:alpha/beta hydrolase [Nocardioidaceae bacterium]